MTERHPAGSTSSMSCARRSAGCSGTWSILRGPGGARPSVGLVADAATGGAQAEATLAGAGARACARSQPRRHEPPDRTGRRRRGGACRHAPHLRGGSRCGSRPRRQGRRLCAARGSAAGAAGLHAARRQPALPLGLADRVSLSRARARADAAHRSVPVRKRLWPRRLPRQDRRSRRAGRASCTTASPKPSSPRSQPPRRPPIWCSSASCAQLKGVDVLITAIALLARDGRRVTATIVGDGPDRAASRRKPRGAASPARSASWAPSRRARALRSGGCWSFLRGRNRCPISCWRRPPPGFRSSPPGSAEFPEIFGPDADDLVPPGDPAGARAAIARPCRIPTAMHDATARLKPRVRADFSVDVMTTPCSAPTHEALAKRHG